ncbi:MAG: tetratricopeptide repeat protein [Pseudobdellovibrio sp.]
MSCIEKSKKILFYIICLTTSLYFNYAFAQNASLLNDKESADYWINKIQQNPTLALNYFNLGVVQQKNQEYEKAIKNYDKAIELKSLLVPVAIYYKARCYESMGKPEEAQRLVSTIELDKVPENLKAKVLVYKNKLYAADVIGDEEPAEPNSKTIEDQQEESKFNAFAEVSKGSNSNPEVYAETQQSSIKADTFGQFRLGATYIPVVSNNYDVKLNYDYSGTQFDKSTGSSYASHDVYIPISIYFDKSRIKLSPQFTLDTYAGSNFSESKGFELSYAFKIDSNYLNFNLQTNQISNKTTTYTYLSGSQQRIGISYDNKSVDSSLKTSLYKTDYKYQDTSTLGSSYTSYSLGFYYTKYIYNFDIGMGVTFDNKQYIKAFSVSTKRQDNKISGSFQIGYSFLEYYRVFLEAYTAKNSSNFNTTTDDRNYQQSIYSLGFSWAY